MWPWRYGSVVAVSSEDLSDDVVEDLEVSESAEPCLEVRRRKGREGRR